MKALCAVMTVVALVVVPLQVWGGGLSAGDVKVPVQKFIESSPNQTFSKLFGIYQPENDGNIAKIFYEYVKSGRRGESVAVGEVNCYKLNSGKWYCGKGIGFLGK